MHAPSGHGVQQALQLNFARYPDPVMAEDFKDASQLFENYFHQDCLLDDPNWESIVQRFKNSEAPETVRVTREDLVRLVAVSTDQSLAEFLFAPPWRSFYDPRAEGITLRGWLEEIVHLLAGGSRSIGQTQSSEARRKATSIAREVLLGKKDLLVGARDLVSLRLALGVPDDDPDFMCFTAIDSETDDLPLGSARSRWSPDALREKDIEITRTREWARSIGLNAFENVVLRFDVAG